MTTNVNVYVLGKTLKDWQAKVDAGQMTNADWHDFWELSLCGDLGRDVRGFINSNWTAIADAYNDKRIDDLKIITTKASLELGTYGKRIEYYVGCGDETKIDEIFGKIAAESPDATTTLADLYSCKNNILLYCALKYAEIANIKLDGEKIRALAKYIKKSDTKTLAEIENFCDKI